MQNKFEPEVNFCFKQGFASSKFLLQATFCFKQIFALANILKQNIANI
jgi:hypothetical protein